MVREDVMQGFLLGLANGTTCLTFCAPVLVPYLLGEGAGVRKNLLTLLQFLIGRLGGYMLFGLVAWATGSLLLGATVRQGVLLGLVYIGLAALLLVTALRRRAPAPGACALEGARTGLTRFRRWPGAVPVGMGLLAGLKVCPPLLLAFAGAASSSSLVGSLTLFLTFFLGTSIYFLPISFLGALRRVAPLRTIGQFAAAIVALYYLYAGVLLVVGGLQ
jgi:sulfite exporter TauE/SafE